MARQHRDDSTTQVRVHIDTLRAERDRLSPDGQRALDALAAAVDTGVGEITQRMTPPERTA